MFQMFKYGQALLIGDCISQARVEIKMTLFLTPYMYAFMDGKNLSFHNTNPMRLKRKSFGLGDGDIGLYFGMNG